jgi:hypothetical protein
LNAESILVGGTRQIASNPNLQNAGNQTYIVAATAKIVVDNGVNAPLQAPEIILASSDRMVGAQLISGNEERAKPARTTAPSIITTEMLGLGSRR